MYATGGGVERRAMPSAGDAPGVVKPSGGRLWLPFFPDCLWQTQQQPTPAASQLSPTSEAAVQDLAFATLASPHGGGWQRVGEWEADEAAAREEALQRLTPRGRTASRRPRRMRRQARNIREPVGP